MVVALPFSMYEEHFKIDAIKRTNHKVLLTLSLSGHSVAFLSLCEGLIRENHLEREQNVDC